MSERASYQLSNSFVSELILNLSKVRLPFQGRGETGDITELCTALIEERSEAGILHLSSRVFMAYEALDQDGRAAFFTHLNNKLDIDADEAANAAKKYADVQSPENYNLLRKSTVSKRFSLFQRLNQVPGGTERLVSMRSELLKLLKSKPELKRTDQDFLFLLRSWFNRGFLVLRNITWDSSAALLEKIIAYEAVHKIHRWNDLRKRLAPDDRRCFAFFHPSMPDEPLIFVEVALTKEIPNSIDAILSDDREPLTQDQFETATFYSISNCQPGLANVSFGNSLIKQVVRNLSEEFPHISNYVTLSPIPKLGEWVKSNKISGRDFEDDEFLLPLAAQYLLSAKREDNLPYDPVARFHLGNGADVFRINAAANKSAEAQKASFGTMVNYRYDLAKNSQNQIRFANTFSVSASREVKNLAKRFIE